MNNIVFKLTKDDEFSLIDECIIINLWEKKDYQYTFFNDRERLSQFPNFFSNSSLDLFYISLMVYYADRKIHRYKSDDAWTRSFKLYVPVLDIERWDSNKKLLEDMISYLSGDIWCFEFRKRDLNEIEKSIEKEFKTNLKKINPDVFCMLSGGLDSFIGAIDLLNSTKNIAFIGHYGKGKGVKEYQDYLISKIKSKYNIDKRLFFSFNASPLRNKEEIEKKIYLEDTTRTRSFMFFTHAIILASTLNNPIELIIPENGLISLNIPLTNTRIGSSSTRTTHPYYMGLLQELINKLELQITLKNPYQFFTKGEMIQNCKDSTFLKENIIHTMSCSHPDRGRFSKKKEPEHCGTCLPCVIRRAAIEKALGIDNSKYTNENFEGLKAKSDLNSFKIGILDYEKQRDKTFRIQNAGPIVDNIEMYCDLYNRGMEEFIQFINKY